MVTKEELIAFEREVADHFNAGKIRAPVHLAGGNEDVLIDFFKTVRAHDWIVGTWRMHYHCLLKGVPPKRLMADILAGRSISLCYPEHKILSSAIVAGHLPIAVGLAMQNKRQGNDDHVFAFLGDMAATTGMFAECATYAEAHKLPITFVVEDNGLSVCTPTQAVFANEHDEVFDQRWRVVRYRYTLPWPHAGAGVRVQF